MPDLSTDDLARRQAASNSIINALLEFSASDRLVILDFVRSMIDTAPSKPATTPRPRPDMSFSSRGVAAK